MPIAGRSTRGQRGGGMLSEPDQKAKRKPFLNTPISTVTTPGPRNALEPQVPWRVARFVRVHHCLGIPQASFTGAEGQSANCRDLPLFSGPLGAVGVDGRPVRGGGGRTGSSTLPARLWQG